MSFVSLNLLSGLRGILGWRRQASEVWVYARLEDTRVALPAESDSAMPDHMAGVAIADIPTHAERQTPKDSQKGGTKDCRAGPADAID